MLVVLGFGPHMAAALAAPSIASSGTNLRSHHPAWRQPLPAKQEQAAFLSEDPVQKFEIAAMPSKAPVQKYSWKWILVGLAVYLVLVVVSAFAYSKFQSDMPLQDMRFLPKDGFSDAIYSCSSSWSICCYACCCPCLRWSDTVSKVNLMYFWMGVILWGILMYINFLVVGLAAPILALLGAAYRYRLRIHFGFPTSYTTMFQDLFAWCCCMPCAIAQEARHVDRTIGIVM